MASWNFQTFSLNPRTDLPKSMKSQRPQPLLSPMRSHMLRTAAVGFKPVLSSTLKPSRSLARVTTSEPVDERL